MRVYRARAWRGGPNLFDPLDSSVSVSGPKGWRFNDLSTEVLYAAEVEALAILEVAVRPGWQTIKQVLIATIEVADGSVVNPRDLGMVLPSNWNARPAADDSRLIAREFFDAIARWPVGRVRPTGVRLRSVLSTTDHTVLLDPSRTRDFSASITGRLPCATLRNAGT